MVKASKKAKVGVPLTIVDLPEGSSGQDSPLGALLTVPKALTPKKAKLRAAKSRSTSKKIRFLKTERARNQHDAASSADLTPSAVVYEDRLARLAAAVQAVRAGQKASPRTTKLLTAGIAKMAQKLVEEAAETAIEAVLKQRASFVNETADLLYNLVVLWTELGVTPAEVWAEMDRREAMLGLAEKLPKTDDIAE
jgi:phosphoribosyl-ATP pyrophosphohydrolase